MNVIFVLEIDLLVLCMLYGRDTRVNYFHVFARERAHAPSRLARKDTRGEMKRRTASTSCTCRHLIVNLCYHNLKLFRNGSPSAVNDKLIFKWPFVTIYVKL